MPRMAREKTLDSVFHVMASSIDEVDLFKGEKNDEYKSRSYTSEK